MGRVDGLRQPIRVLIVDRSVLTLQGIKDFFAKSHQIEVIGMAGTRQDALQAIHVEQPNVVLVEVRVGADSGIELCRTIRESHPQVRVLFFTAQDDKDILREAIMAGAHGYVLKSATAESITRSIEAVASGGAIMDQHLTEQLIRWLRDDTKPGQEQWKETCSREERYLLSLVASGKTNKEIGLELNVAHSVVASRLQKIYKRLKISRRAEAARYYTDLEQKRPN
ncbi:MAG: response regulator transcription factor [Nitrospira sp.]|nr:response regulator transcription factor [Nitrospira sp.]MDH4305772.1 response regulator transcription factor [Nitrospira sp.]MDH5195380.1 response regulator transcription factor [Nitrospira sp.]